MGPFTAEVVVAELLGAGDWPDVACSIGEDEILDTVCDPLGLGIFTGVPATGVCGTPKPETTCSVALSVRVVNSGQLLSVGNVVD